jgi:hypothetical protein
MEGHSIFPGDANALLGWVALQSCHRTSVRWSFTAISALDLNAMAQHLAHTACRVFAKTPSISLIEVQLGLATCGLDRICDPF